MCIIEKHNYKIAAPTETSTIFLHVFAEQKVEAANEAPIEQAKSLKCDE